MIVRGSVKREFGPIKISVSFFLEFSPGSFLFGFSSVVGSFVVNIRAINNSHLVIEKQSHI